MSRDADDLLNIINPNEESDTLTLTKLGTIPASYVSGEPTVLFDGEEVVSTSTYPCCGRYIPAANDRVILLRVSNGWVILDKIQED